MCIMEKPVKTTLTKMDFWDAVPSMGITPEANDVLCGRGRTAFQHTGNSRLRVLIARSLDRFTSSKTRMEKTNIVRSIVQNVLDCGGRFLKRDPSKTYWYLAGFKKAREKVSHAFRDASSDKVKCMIVLKDRFADERLGKKNKIVSPLPEMIVQQQKDSMIRRDPDSRLIFFQGQDTLIRMINGGNAVPSPFVARTITPFFPASTVCRPSSNEMESANAREMKSDSVSSDCLDIYNDLSCTDLGWTDCIDDFTSIDYSLDNLLWQAMSLDLGS